MNHHTLAQVDIRGGIAMLGTGLPGGRRIVAHAFTAAFARYISGMSTLTRLDSVSVGQAALSRAGPPVTRRVTASSHSLTQDSMNARLKSQTATVTARARAQSIMLLRGQRSEEHTSE